MAAPLPGSSGSTRRTEAPAVMSASACCCIVLALPWALSILNWSADSPAASNACFRYGASYVTYRAEVVVSGSRTPMRPLPWAAMSVSSFISEKSAVNAAASIWGTSALAFAEGVVVVEDDLHAARTTAVRQLATTTARRLFNSMLSSSRRQHGSPDSLDRGAHPPGRCRDVGAIVAPEGTEGPARPGAGCRRRFGA